MEKRMKKRIAHLPAQEIRTFSRRFVRRDEASLLRNPKSKIENPKSR
jgi:hypothetical protein